MTRRRFLGLAGAAAVGAAAHGMVIEPRWLDVTQHILHIDDLPHELDGYLIAHLTDLHLRGPLGHLHDAIFAELARQRPKLILMTGDMVEDGSGLVHLDDFFQKLPRQDARVMATLGNWEHSKARVVGDITKLYAAHDIDLMVNQTIMVGAVAVSGVDDAVRGHADVRPILTNHPGGAVRILATHSPIIFDEFTPPVAFDIGLAGHTHGGQVRVGSVAPVLPYGSGRFVAGFYDAACGRVYVSRGLGTTMIPVRFMCRPELPFFRLKRG